MTLLRMLAFQPEKSAARVDGGPKRATASVGKTAAELKPSPTTAESDTSIVAPNHDARDWQEPEWGALIAQLDINGANRLLASNCAYLHRAGNTLFLSLDARSESLLTASRQKVLTDALTRYFGERLTLDISLQESANEPEVVTPQQEELRDHDARMNAARQSLESDPGVHALKDMFGAEMKPDTVEIVENQTAHDRE